MKKQAGLLAVSLAVVSVLAGASYADNAQFQTSFDPFSPNTSLLSNNDLLSDNVTDAANDKSILSHNDLSTNDSFNTKIKVDDSFNDNSTNHYDSHDDFSDNQAAVGQVNLNDSYAEDINAANNNSTIFDGDVRIGDGGGWGWGGGGYNGDNNINTGIITDSIQGDYSAQFKNVGVGLNNSSSFGSTLNSTQTENVNLL